LGDWQSRDRDIYRDSIYWGAKSVGLTVQTLSFYIYVQYYMRACMCVFISVCVFVCVCKHVKNCEVCSANVRRGGVWCCERGPKGSRPQYAQRYAERGLSLSLSLSLSWTRSLTHSCMHAQSQINWCIAGPVCKVLECSLLF